MKISKNLKGFTSRLRREQNRKQNDRQNEDSDYEYGDDSLDPTSGDYHTDHHINGVESTSKSVVINDFNSDVSLNDMIHGQTGTEKNVYDNRPTHAQNNEHAETAGEISAHGGGRFQRGNFEFYEDEEDATAFFDQNTSERVEYIPGESVLQRAIRLMEEEEKKICNFRPQEYVDPKVLSRARPKN